MDFSDLLLKIGKGEKLTPLELVNLRDQARAMEEIKNNVKNWTQVGTTSPNLNQPQISQPHWIGSPLDVYTFNVQTDATIADNTATYITFDDYTYTNSKAFRVDPSDATKILTKYAGQSFAICGVVEWATDGTGYRNAQLEGFNTAGVSLGGVSLHTLPANSADVTACPCSFVVNFRQLAELAYFKIKVRQTSGGNLTLRYGLFSVFLV